MKIRVAFFKGKGDWKNAVVRWWTRSEYSHADLVLPDGITWVGISPFIKSAVAKRISLGHNPAEWEFIDIQVSEEQYSVIMDFFQETCGQKYDWVGMLCSQFLPFKIKHKRRWYCSEWIAYALRIACIYDWRKMRMYDRKDLSPAALYEIIKYCEK